MNRPFWNILLPSSKMKVTFAYHSIGGYSAIISFTTLTTSSVFGFAK